MTVHVDLSNPLETVLNGLVVLLLVKQFLSLDTGIALVRGSCKVASDLVWFSGSARDARGFICAI